MINILLALNSRSVLFFPPWILSGPHAVNSLYSCISGEFSVASILTTSFCSYLSFADGLIPRCNPQTTDFLAKLFTFGKGEENRACWEVSVHSVITCGEQSFPRKHRNCGKISMGVNKNALKRLIRLKR